MHTPVLLDQVIKALDIKKNNRYIDATFGEGGYSQVIVKKGGQVLGLDIDKKQIDDFQTKSINNLKLVVGNFADIESIAKENDFFPVDGIVFDLGLSMNQLKSGQKGLSYKQLDEILDMRLSDSDRPMAKDLIKKLSVEELYQVLAHNCEEIRSKEIAVAIKRCKRMEYVGDLLNAIDWALGYQSSSVYARIFQALRIEVNDEINNLKKGLLGGFQILKKNGRMVIVSFHSLEDRIVKQFIKSQQAKTVSKKPLKGVSGFERSAIMRTIIK